MNTHLILLGVAAFTGYGIWAYTHPWRPCWACGGKGTNRGSTKRRSGRCWRCGGSKQVKTLGSRMLHKAVRSLVDHAKGRKP